MKAKGVLFGLLALVICLFFLAGPARATDPCPKAAAAVQVQAAAVVQSATVVTAVPVVQTVAVAQPVVVQSVAVQAVAVAPVTVFGVAAVHHPAVAVAVKGHSAGVQAGPRVIRQRTVIRR